MAAAFALALLPLAAHAGKFERLRDQALSGTPADQRIYGEFLLNHRKYDSGDGALQWLTKAAEAGDVQAAADMGDVYYVRDNDTEALRWFTIAADRGSARGIDYVCGRLAMEPDWNRTLPYCQKALSNNSATGLAYMGEAYVYGYGGLTSDVSRGTGYLIQAVTMKSYHAMETLSRLYYDGKLVPQNYVSARHLAQAALFQDSYYSLPWLADIYERGLGIPAEPLEAQRLYFLAALKGLPEGKAWMAQHPEVTEDSLKDNWLHLLNVPGGPYTLTVKKWTGATETVDAVQTFFTRIDDRYPEAAIDDEIEGTTVGYCHWDDSGNLDNCVIVDETPRHYGFAQATLDGLAPFFATDQKDAWTANVKGHALHFTMHWVLD